VASTVLVSCQAVGGIPPPTVHWSITVTGHHRNEILSRITARPITVDRPLTWSSGANDTDVVQNIELQLVNVTLKDSGTVVNCWTENAAGISRTKWTINVYEPSELVYSSANCDWLIMNEKHVDQKSRSMENSLMYTFRLLFSSGIAYQKCLRLLRIIETIKRLQLS